MSVTDAVRKRLKDGRSAAAKNRALRGFLSGLIVLAAAYVVFRVLGAFSSRQSIVLAAMTSGLVYGFKRMTALLRAPDAFSPFRVTIDPDWYALLTDFELLKSDDEWNKLCQADSERPRTGVYDVFRQSIEFTVVKPRAGLSRPGLIFWGNQKEFLTEVDLSAPVFEVNQDKETKKIYHVGKEDPFFQQHPFFHHPRSPTLRFFCKCGPEGYDLGLEVGRDWREDRDWWEQLWTGKEFEGLSKIKKDEEHYWSVDRKRLIIATLRYSELDPYYQNSDSTTPLEETQGNVGTTPEATAWEREVYTFGVHLRHKYFYVYHQKV